MPIISWRRFLSCVDMSPEPGPASGHSRGPGLARLSAGRKEAASSAGPGRILVISGGDG